MAVERPSPLNITFVQERATDREVAVAVAQTLGFPGTDKGTSIEPGMLRSGRDEGQSTWVFAPVPKDAVYPGGAVVARIPDVIVTDIGDGMGKFRVETGKAFHGDVRAFTSDVRKALSQPAGKNGR